MRLAPLAIALSLASTPALADDAALNKLVADYEAYSLSQDPLLASSQGDRAALSRLPDPSLAADAARSKRLKELQKQLAAIKPSELSAQAGLNREFLEWTLERQIQRLAFDEARMPFSSDDGFDWTISYLASSTPMRTLADGRAWIDRLNAVPA